MNKSFAYQAAQFAVLRDTGIANSDKLKILRILMEDEHLALFCEKQEKEREKEQEA